MEPLTADSDPQEYLLHPVRPWFSSNCATGKQKSTLPKQEGGEAHPCLEQEYGPTARGADRIASTLQNLIGSS